MLTKTAPTSHDCAVDRALGKVLAVLWLTTEVASSVRVSLSQLMLEENNDHFWMMEGKTWITETQIRTKIPLEN